MAMFYENMSDKYRNNLDIVNLLFTYIFIIEMVLKIIA